MQGSPRFLIIVSLLAVASRAQDFDPARFRQPPVEFYPSAFWNWNTAMTPSLIREQIADMDSHKLRTLCILPMPRDFRPDTTGNHLDVDYLSPEYFDRYRLALEDAKKRGMLAWLYDEGGWPSGSATGRVVRSNPAFGAQTLVAERVPLNTPAPADAVANFVVGGDTRVICRIQRSDSQPDRLNPEATRRFIELTHEGYRRMMPDALGTLMPWTFTDEPAVPRFVPGKQVPWTAELPEIFRKKKGYDLIAALPLLLGTANAETAEARRARIDFFDVWSELFQQAYLFPIRDWCRRYGILSSGHFGGDDETTGSAQYGYGHILRAMRGLDFPGVDTIWRQLFPGQPNHYFPRYASSVAHQEGRRLVLTESFAVYGNGLTLAEMKWLINYQYVRGCNVTVMGNYPAGTSGNLMSGERPHFGPMNPLWEFQPLFQDYTARLGYLLSLGKPAADIALYLPVRDFWASVGKQDTPESRANDAAAFALEKQLGEFDFVDDDLLSPAAARNGAIHAGQMSYQTLVVSETHTMPDTTAEAIAQFVKSGGTLIVVDKIPETGPLPHASFLDTLGISPPQQGERRKLGRGFVVFTSLADLSKWAPPSVSVRSPSDSVRATLRHLAAGELAVITNESSDWVTADVEMPGRGSVYQLDLDSGEMHRAERRIALPPWGEAALIKTRTQQNVRPWQLADRNQPLALEGAWQIRRLKQIVIEKDDYAQRALADDPWRPARLGEWQELIGSDFSGSAEYRLEFDYKARPQEFPLLDLGKVGAAAEVWLNGKRLGARAWSPYLFDTKDALRQGSNELRIQVTNTLANYLASPAVRASWASRTGPGWPGPYDARAHAFEEKSTASGLFGPVQLFAAKPAK